MKRADYKRQILRVLAGLRRPTDVEKIRVACHIGNWQTALKHCLELQLEGKIQGVKSSKSWVFWAISHHKESSDSVKHVQAGRRSRNEF